MQIIVTGARHGRTRVLHVAGWQLLGAALLAAALLLALVGGAYQLLAGRPLAAKGGRCPVARCGRWRARRPRAATATCATTSTRMAAKLGALQAKLLRLDAVGARACRTWPD
jgi:hypothetical protein